MQTHPSLSADSLPILQGLDESDDEEEDGPDEDDNGKSVSSPAATHKRAVQARTSRIAKRTRTAESPTSDTSTDRDEAEEAPPQATLSDEEMEEDEAEDDNSIAQSHDDDNERTSNGEEMQHDVESDESEGERRRRRSVAVPTPRFAPKSRMRAMESPGKGELSPLRSGRQLSAVAESETGTESAMQRPFAQRLGLEPKKLAVMQASFFSKPSSAAQSAQSAKESKKQVAAPPASILPPQQPAFALQATLPDQQEQEDYIPSYKPLRKWKASSLENSLLASKEGNLADAGAALSRSFGLSWGPQGQLVTNGSVGRLQTSE